MPISERTYVGWRLSIHVDALKLYGPGITYIFCDKNNHFIKQSFHTFLCPVTTCNDWFHKHYVQSLGLLSWYLQRKIQTTWQGFSFDCFKVNKYRNAPLVQHPLSSTLKSTWNSTWSHLESRGICWLYNSGRIPGGSKTKSGQVSEVLLTASPWNHLAMETLRLKNQTTHKI